MVRMVQGLDDLQMGDGYSVLNSTLQSYFY